jgi:hypothetical protein
VLAVKKAVVVGVVAQDVLNQKQRKERFQMKVKCIHW